MAHYVGVAGTKQISNALVDRAIEAFRKFSREAEEAKQTPSTLKAGGRFTLDGEGVLDKDNSLGVGVRAAAPEIATTIPVELGVDANIGRTAQGHMGAAVTYEFECRIEADNREALAILRERERLALAGQVVTDSTSTSPVEDPNRLGRN